MTSPVNELLSTGLLLVVSWVICIVPIPTTLACDSAKPFRVVLKVDAKYAGAGSYSIQSAKVMDADEAVSEWTQIGAMSRGLDYSVCAASVVTAVLLDSGNASVNAAGNDSAVDRVHFAVVGNCWASSASFDRSHPCYDSATQTIVSPGYATAVPLPRYTSLAANAFTTSSARQAVALYNGTLRSIAGNSNQHQTIAPWRYSTASATNTAAALDFSPLYGLASINSVPWPGQATVHAGNKVYGFHAYTNPATGYDTLIIYNLDTYAFVDTSTYSHTSLYSSLIPCATYEPFANEIYVTAGQNNPFTTPGRLEKYNIDNDTWTLLANSAQFRDSSGCAFNADSSHLYQFGGYPWTSSIVEYSVADNDWTTVSGMTQVKNGVACVLVPFDLDTRDAIDDAGLIFCVGGSMNGGGQSSRIEIFNPITKAVDISRYALSAAGSAMALVIDQDTKCLLMAAGANIYYLCRCTHAMAVNVQTCSFIEPFDYSCDATVNHAHGRRRRRLGTHKKAEL